MYPFVRAGIHAASLQTALVIALAFIEAFAGSVWQVEPGSAAMTTAERASEPATAIALVDVLMAAVVSMLRTRSVTKTARQLANGFRRISPRNPERAAAALVAQLLLASLGLAAIALRSPPDWFRSLATLLVGTGPSICLWPGMTSIGIAAFGANAHAAILGGAK